MSLKLVVWTIGNQETNNPGPYKQNPEHNLSKVIRPEMKISANPKFNKSKKVTETFLRLRVKVGGKWRGLWRVWLLVVMGMCRWSNAVYVSSISEWVAFGL